MLKTPVVSNESAPLDEGLLDEAELRESVNRGIADLEAGRLTPSAEARARILATPGIRREPTP